MPKTHALCCLALTCLLLGCERGHKAAATTQGVEAERATLVVGVSRSYPPIIFKEGERTVGLEADFARKLGEELGMAVEFRPMFWPDLINELSYKRIDIIMSGMSITPARQRLVGFAEPYLAVGQLAMVRTADRAVFADAEAIMKTDRRIGVEMGSTSAKFAYEKVPNAGIINFATVAKATAALRDKQVDLVIHDSPSLYWIKANAGEGLHVVPHLLTREQLAWAVRSDNTELLSKVNAVLKRWRASGELKQMIDHWLGAR